MNDSLKEKTIFNLLWSAFDKVGQQVISVVITIFLANLLTPDDYGLLGVLTIFITLSGLLTESGFGSALIHKKEVTQQDYASVFYFNLAVSIVLYLLLYGAAGWIAGLYQDARLFSLSRFIFLAIPANALLMVQNTQLIKAMHFKVISKANLIALLVSSAVALYLAFKGYGVWALAAQSVSLAVCKFIVVFLYNRWYPRERFSFQPIKAFLPYSSRLLAGGFLNGFFNNIYPTLVRLLGYPMAQVGIYTQANKLQEIPSLMISNTFNSVSFPVLASVKEDPERVVRILGKTVRTITFFIFPVMLGLFIIADPLILTLLPERWAACIPVFKILCFGGVVMPYSPVFTNLFLAKGKSDTYFHFEWIRKGFLTGGIVIGSFFGISGLAFSWVAYSFFSLFLGLLFAKKISGYGFDHFIRDTFSLVLATVAMIGLVWLWGCIINNLLVLLLVQVASGIILYVLFVKYIVRSDVYKDIEQQLLRKDLYES